MEKTRKEMVDMKRDIVNSIKESLADQTEDLKKSIRKYSKKDVATPTATEQSLKSPSSSRAECPSPSTPSVSRSFIPLQTPEPYPSSSAPSPGTVYYGSFTLDDLRKSIPPGTDAKKVAKHLASKIFTKEQLMACSFTGKPTKNNNFSPRPALDAKCRDIILKLTQEAVPGTDYKKIYEAVTCHQKVLRAAKRNEEKKLEN